MLCLRDRFETIGLGRVPTSPAGVSLKWPVFVRLEIPELRDKARRLDRDFRDFWPAPDSPGTGALLRWAGPRPDRAVQGYGASGDRSRESIARPDGSPLVGTVCDAIPPRRSQSVTRTGVSMPGLSQESRTREWLRVAKGPKVTNWVILVPYLSLQTTPIQEPAAERNLFYEALSDIGPALPSRP